MKETQDLIININDNYGEKCLVDDCSGGEGITRKRKPEGRVEIYEVDDNGNKILINKKNNLVLYQAREYIAERILALNNSNTNVDHSDYLCWFGLGDGGVDPSDPYNPYPPSNSDLTLANEIPINESDSSCGDLRGDGKYYKHPFDTTTFEQDSANDNAWLVVNITTTISAYDGNGYQLSEAGLYLASDNSAGYSGDFWLFGRVTFPVIVKTDSRRLVFIWYLYF